MTQETALINVRPDTDSRIAALYEEGVRLELYARERIIESIEDVKAATDDLSIIAKLKKALEEKRKEYIGPINEHLKTVNGVFKSFVEPLSQADSITREKVLAYRAQQESIRVEQERINQLRMQAAEAEMKLKGELSEPLGLVEVAPNAATRYQTDSGTLGTAKIKKWEVTDITLVPIEYLVVDTVKIGKVVRAGIPGIPGIRIWEEDSLRITAR